MVASTDGPSGGLQFLKRLVVGRALASHTLEHQLLLKFLALPVYIKRLLLFEPQVVVTSVPFHLRDAAAVASATA